MENVTILFRIRKCDPIVIGFGSAVDCGGKISDLPGTGRTGFKSDMQNSQQSPIPKSNFRNSKSRNQFFCSAWYFNPLAGSTSFNMFMAAIFCC